MDRDDRVHGTFEIVDSSVTHPPKYPIYQYMS